MTPRATRRHCTLVALPIAALLICTLAACDDGSPNDTNNDCPTGQVYNPTLDRCIAQVNDMGGDGFFPDTGHEEVQDDTTTTPDLDDTTTPDDDTPQPDVVPDTRPETIDPQCDQDNDGFASIECGGRDCDDNNIFANPGRAEICDFIDNNCDGQRNEGLDCTFYAHTRTTLYRIDPFNPQAEPVVVTSVPELHDIDTHPNGTLYGVTTTHLYQFNSGQIVWTLVGAFPNAIEDANGLAIDSDGNAFVTSGNQLYAVNLTNPGNSTLVGNLGNDPSGDPWYSSGDCVLNKSDTLYMSAKKQGQPDKLVIVDRDFATTTEVGSMGIASVYGLTSAWGRLFGVTSSGYVVEIDRTTGRATTIHNYSGLSFWGAASTPDR